MAYDFRDERNNWTGSCDDSGYCSDRYGHYTGRVSDDGSISDRYGNYIGSIDSSTGKIYDRYGKETTGYGRFI